MKTKIVTIALLVIAAVAFAFCGSSEKSNKEPWKSNQLMEPSELAKIINDSLANKPVIYSIGPVGNIKGCIHLGPASEKKNLDPLKTKLSKLNKDANIVIFCGCCPFVHCPNIRPAFQLLNDMHFTNAKLLNLSNNLKVDWIDKGYPVNE